MSRPELPPDPGLTAIEAALGSLSPTPAQLDRDRLMFLAGRASHRPSPAARWAWPALAAGLAVVALGEAALLTSRPEPRVVERLVHVPAPAPEPPSPAPSVASVSDELAPVVILHRTRRDDRRLLASEPPRSAGLQSDLRRLRVQHYGLDVLPDPPPLPMAMRPTDERPEPPGRLLRSEIERLLNPGESS